MEKWFLTSLSNCRTSHKLSFERWRLVDVTPDGVSTTAMERSAIENLKEAHKPTGQKYSQGKPVSDDKAASDPSRMFDGK